MPHLFESKDSFKESFKEAVSDAYGRDFEDTYPEERYIVLGNICLLYTSPSPRD